MLTQSGIPVIYSGDEIGQENDYSYNENSNKKEDSRYLHRGEFQWVASEKRNDAESIQGRVFQGIKAMTDIRKNHTVFSSEADVWTIHTHDSSVLGLVRKNKDENLIALFNFSESEKEVWIEEADADFTNLLTKNNIIGKNVELEPFGMCWLMKGRL